VNDHQIHQPSNDNFFRNTSISHDEPVSEDESIVQGWSCSFLWMVESVGTSAVGALSASDAHDDYFEHILKWLF